MKTIIKNREQTCKLNLVLWCLGQDSLVKVNSAVLEKQTFESITVQGDFLMPSYQTLVPNLFVASVNLKLHGCSFKITSDLTTEISTQLSHIRVLNLKEVKIQGLDLLMEKCYNLREFKYHALTQSDTVAAFSYKQRTPHLRRVCAYTHWSPDRLL